MTNIKIKLIERHGYSPIISYEDVKEVQLLAAGVLSILTFDSRNVYIPIHNIAMYEIREEENNVN